ILEHVRDAEQGYLRRIAGTFKADPAAAFQAEMQRTHQAVLDALDAGMAHGLPRQGPRGGAIWPLRYFLRRAGWHVTDHIREIEDRSS
ncbi:MAG: hypothetical protein KDD83_29410, partial [Caldilineaceae bacterium]|nr:hypothetical protein [Caldilineaceae bacterium]